MNLDRLIVGTNSMLGVDHLDRSRTMYRSEIDEARFMQILEAGKKEGANGLTFTSGSLVERFVDLTKSQNLNYNLYPVVANPADYLKSVSELGLVGFTRDLLSGLGVRGKIQALLNGGVSTLTGDVRRAIRVLIVAEIDNLLDVIRSRDDVKCLLVHDILTDLVVGLGAVDLISDFCNIVDDRYHITPGFVTRNFVRFIELCKGKGLPLEDIVVMTPFNKIGFQMTPSREKCEETIRGNQDAHVIAISILAAGQLNVYESAEYLSAFPGIRSVVAGVSSESHARETFAVLRKALLSHSE